MVAAMFGSMAFELPVQLALHLWTRGATPLLAADWHILQRLLRTS